MLILVGLVLCLAPADALTAFPPKIVVGSLNEDLVVKCNTSKQQVTWTQNGELEPMAELVAKGRTLTILGLDLPATGNYSCWAGGVLLDTTYVVVRDTGEEEGKDVSCQADSYRGSFRCSWTGPRSAIFRARLTRRWVPGTLAPAPRAPSAHACLVRSNGSFGDWVPVAGRGGQFNASFTDPSFCPFAEELHQLQLHLEGISDTSFFNFTSPRFFIRDIGELNPATAGSYFALLYRLQYELSNGTQVEKFVEGAEKTIVQGHVRRVRISCQDPYAKPSWSPWSPWQMVDAAQQHRLRAR
ncbi:interleukin-12 subunit beta-like [Cygnus olor]|uniref:interleukin-12 subunit beta-like n=1 Tax=Cygnus olor TaxID=8869 RepID=UPI001ADDE6C7|nr:interleukin-12 subunit beta-like [Cygnus olor]